MRLTESYWTLFEIDINGLNCALITARRVFVEKLPSASSTRLTEALKAATVLAVVSGLNRRTTRAGARNKRYRTWRWLRLKFFFEQPY